MTQFEKAEIRRLPKKYRPMGAWGYFWHSVLYSIPVLGWICLIWGAVNDKNICRRSYARSYFVVAIVAFILGIILGVLVALNIISMDMLTGALDNVDPGQTV